MSILSRQLKLMPDPARSGRMWVALLAVVVAAGTGLSAGGVASASAPAAAASAAVSPAAHPTERLCGRPAKPRQMTCMSVRRTDVEPKKGVLAPQVAPSGHGPSALRSAYTLPSGTAGAGQTVAIVDAYDSPNAEADLAIYRAQYGLPPCTTANGCFRKVDQRGGTNYPAEDSGWAGEIALDVDMVSAVCPNCNILLVEGDDASFESLGAAVNMAVALDAKYVSNSYGDRSGEGSYDLDLNAYYDHPGVVITASSGDWGYGVSYPTAAPGVTSVGGTSLFQDGGGNWTESVWNGAGSGCSRYQVKPAWQSDTGCARRTVTDVSAVADPQTGVAIYYNGWAVYGGTSASAPIIAAAYALAGAPQAGTDPTQYPYDSRTVGAAQELNDVIGGNNGGCNPAYLCTGVEGYDGPTGLGTPHGVGALTYRAHGHIVGTVTDAAGGQPMAGVTVKAADRITRSNAQGHYDLDLPAATYQVSATTYGHQAAPVDGIVVTAGSTVTQDLAMAPTPHATVAGAVTDGSGHGWPLYAKVTASDGTSTTTAFTDPATGRYSLSLMQNADYTLHITPVDTSYQPVDKTITVGSSDLTENATLTIGAGCTAPGYQAIHSGIAETFDTGKIPSRWKVTNTDLHLPGYGYQPGWEFDNPANRPNNTGGSGSFAIVDSDHDGQHNIQNTRLISPVVDMSSYDTPAIEFANDLKGAANSTATVDVSVDGGATWTNAWRNAGRTGVPGPGPVVVTLPQAAHKAQVQVRLGYTGQWSQWWAIDNMFLGNRICKTLTGGLVVGQVTARDGSGVNGATVTSVTKPDQHTITRATPDDPNVGDGLYWLFSPGTGDQQFTATMTGYGEQTVTAAVTADEVTQLKFTLAPSAP